MSDPIEPFSFADGTRQWDVPADVSWFKTHQKEIKDWCRAIGFVMLALTIASMGVLISADSCARLEQEQKRSITTYQTLILSENQWMQDCLEEKRLYECVALGEAGNQWHKINHNR